MTVIYIDDGERKCPFCKLFIKPRTTDYNDRMEVICPKCKRTIEILLK